MGAGADWKRVRRLGRYLARDRRRLFVTLALLVPVALAGSIQPLLVGQAISVLRREPSLPWLSGLGQSKKQKDKKVTSGDGNYTRAFFFPRRRSRSSRARCYLARDEWGRCRGDMKRLFARARFWILEIDASLGVRARG